MQPYGNETKPGIVWVAPRGCRRRRSHDWPRDRKEWRQWRRIQRHYARAAAREHIAFELAAGETMAEALESVERGAFFGLSIMWRDPEQFDAAVRTAERQHDAEVRAMLNECARERDRIDDKYDDFTRVLLLGGMWDDPVDPGDDPLDDFDDFDICNEEDPL